MTEGSIRDDAAVLTGRLGLVETGPGCFRAVVRGRDVVLRSLRSVDEMVPLEELQRQVMGAPDLDVYGRATLVTIPSTGGHVIGAFAVDPDGPDRLAAPDGPDDAAGRPVCSAGGPVVAGALIGLGGFVDGVPLVVSDWMGVRPKFRSAGLGAAMKRVQAVLALRGGFGQVVWTVDPLRAANARLNHGVLGAVAVGYEVDRYGSDYAAGLYGGLPSDRLVLRWSIADPAVQRWMADPPAMSTVDELRTLTDRRVAANPAAGAPDSDELHGFVEIPPDVDALLAADPTAVVRERERVRAQLTAAFDAGSGVVGFAAPGRSGRPALVLGPVKEAVRP